jgi:hypothetical protein
MHVLMYVFLPSISSMFFKCAIINQDVCHKNAKNQL